MQKVGDYWVPDIDMFWFRNRRKTLDNYRSGGHGKQIHHIDQVIDLIQKNFGASNLSSSVALDAGANIGAYSRRMAETFGEVHAIELASDTFACLAKNIDAWGLSEKVHVHHAAVSDQPGFVGMGSGGWLRRSISREIKGQGNIPAVTIDSLVLERVVLIKLDVEGHELQALNGALDTISRCQPYIMMELKARHIEKGTADLRAHNALISMGYEIVADLGTPALDRLYAYRGK